MSCFAFPAVYPFVSYNYIISNIPLHFVIYENYEQGHETFHSGRLRRIFSFVSIICRYVK